MCFKNFSPNISVVESYKRGYRVTSNGEISKNGIIIKGRVDKAGYNTFSIRIKGKIHKISVHRLCAYQKYGDIIFNCDCVRHIDGNPLNNKPNNIEIGTFSENMMDIPKSIRVRKSSNANKKYSDSVVLQIRKLYSDGVSMKELMGKYNISSKGTFSYILNSRLLLDSN